MATKPYAITDLTSNSPLSKSKFVHGMQCPLYVWLEVRTDLPQPEPGAFTQALFDTGNEVGELARQRWDARLAAAGMPTGVRITDDRTLHKQAVADTSVAMLDGAGAVHEAAFTHGGVKIRIDVLELLEDGTYALNEVKSTSKYEEKKHPVARPTRDIDFLGRIDSSPESVESTIRECLEVAVEDGLEFSPRIDVEPITIEDRYPGARAVIRGALSGARIVLQLDIGIADVAVPDPGWVDYPTLLEMESPRILAYQPSTAVAEKFQTMIEKGLLNSRVKDYYDIWMLANTIGFDGVELRDAIRATFDRRDTDVPHDRPSVLGDEYASQEMTHTQWAAFAKKMRASGVEVPSDFSIVVEHVSNFLMPVAAAAAARESFDKTWKPGRGWS